MTIRRMETDALEAVAPLLADFHVTTRSTIGLQGGVPMPSQEYEHVVERAKQLAPEEQQALIEELLACRVSDLEPGSAEEPWTDEGIEDSVEWVNQQRAKRRQRYSW